MTDYQYDGVVFDLDGTLVDTAPDLLASTNYVMDLYSRPAVTMDIIKDGISFGAKRMMRDAFLSNGGITGINLDSALPDFLNYYHEHICIHSKLFEGGYKFLIAAKEAGIPVAVCTNKSVELATHLLNELDIMSLLTALTGGNSFTFKKPDARHLTETRNLMKLDKSHTILMVGDSSNDINAAKNAGWDSAVVTFGYLDVSLESLQATYEINSLADLIPIVGL
ncbi:HAD-IA family hydrolase [Temperatibacter marinus]|uniref:phosphoglycolate phosphatase n=1 Tax=Temperatibacter marinus TaxID=1456591 RepID=A0AA52EHG0_9PROT|nr:HAD-IA family hydrolase [Temperatibacter marinus]WND02592.1 HAD-IA family hydrolase [Temperatibacter marinus]